MIHDDLVRAYDRAEARDEFSRWRAFSVAVLQLVIGTNALAGEAASLVASALDLWRLGEPRDEALSELRVAAWRYLREKNGDSATIRDAEDRALRASLTALWPKGDRDAAVEAAGWVEDFLAGAVS